MATPTLTKMKARVGIVSLIVYLFIKPQKLYYDTIPLKVQSILLHLEKPMEK
jgi:hypothetical protein